MIRAELKKYYKIAILSILVVIFIFVVGLIIFKYQMEGENIEELPFNIEKISIVSTADGIKSEENSEYLWSGNIIQVNDIYIKIEKNEASEGIIKSVIINNIEATLPEKGELKFTRLLKNKDTSNNYIIEDINEYNYFGDTVTSLENMKIANQGGNIGIRIINNNLGSYNSNEEEINYDGRILNIENIKNSDIKFKLKFDVCIEILNGIKYKTTIELDMPEGNIIENGIEIKEYNELKNLIYKRY